VTPWRWSKQHGFPGTEWTSAVTRSSAVGTNSGPFTKARPRNQALERDVVNYSRLMRGRDDGGVRHERCR